MRSARARSSSDGQLPCAGSVRRRLVTPGSAQARPRRSRSGWIGSRTVNVEPWSSPGLEAMISPWCWLMIRCVIESPRPVPLPSRRLVKNGSKMFSSTSGVMPQPLSVKTISAIPWLYRASIRKRPAGVHRFERVDDQVQDDLLDFLAVDVGHHGFAGLEDDRLAPVFADVADHVDDALDQAGQLGPLALDVVAAREVEQLLGDALAAERFFLDHLQIVGDDPVIGVARRSARNRSRR